MTATAEHVITVTELGGDIENKRRPVQVTCSCGTFDQETAAILADLIGDTHVQHATRPTVSRAEAIARGIRRGELTAGQADQLAQVLLHAADLADRVDVVVSRKLALDALVKLVRGEA